MKKESVLLLFEPKGTHHCVLDVVNISWQYVC